MIPDAKPVKGTPDGVDFFSSNAKVGTLSQQSSRIGGETVRFDAPDPTHVYMGGWTGHPFTTYLPSDTVTPHTVWLPIPPEIGAIGSILWAIKSMLDSLEEDWDHNHPHRPGTITRLEKTQIFDYNVRLPENV